MSLPYEQKPDIALLVTIWESEQCLTRQLSRQLRRGIDATATYELLRKAHRDLQDIVTKAGKGAPKLIQEAYVQSFADPRPLTAADEVIIHRLADDLEGHVIEAVNTAQQSLETNFERAVQIGRKQADAYARAQREAVLLGRRAGAAPADMARVMQSDLERHGITGFVDARGRRTSLYNYCNMATRTLVREAQNAGILMANTEHDLYVVSSSGSVCPQCAPLEGRVFSKSGTDKRFPGLTDIFPMIDTSGPADISNVYLDLHPFCVHFVSEWYEDEQFADNVATVITHSSFETNPRTIDPRTEAQKQAYYDKVRGRAKLLNDYKQFQRYQIRLGDNVPKTFQTFQKHKMANSEKYQAWQQAYRQAGGTHE